MIVLFFPLRSMEGEKEASRMLLLLLHERLRVETIGKIEKILAVLSSCIVAGHIALHLGHLKVHYTGI